MEIQQPDPILSATVGPPDQVFGMKIAQGDMWGGIDVIGVCGIHCGKQIIFTLWIGGIVRCGQINHASGAGLVNDAQRDFCFLVVKIAENIRCGPVEGRLVLRGGSQVGGKIGAPEITNDHKANGRVVVQNVGG